MSVRKFIIQICGVFLSISLSETIEIVITNFSWEALAAGILIFFLSLNFFFAKFKQLQEGTDAISFGGFIANILTLSCFAAMPFLIGNFTGLMCAQIFLRVSDIVLIAYNNRGRKIDRMERRWLIFDVTYLLAVILFIVLEHRSDWEYMATLLLGVYLLMGVFEALFDFWINGREYGMIRGEDGETAATSDPTDDEDIELL